MNAGALGRRSSGPQMKTKALNLAYPVITHTHYM